jgi:hypothetical protein
MEEVIFVKYGEGPNPGWWLAECVMFLQFSTQVAHRPGKDARGKSYIIPGTPPQPTSIAMASWLVKFIWKFRQPKPDKAWNLKKAAWDTIKNRDPDVREILIRRL